MTKDEARKVAAGIAKLPDLLKRTSDPENEKGRQLDGPRRERGTAFSCRSPEARNNQPSHRGHGRRDVPASRDILLARSGVNTSTSKT
jgi:hypothetical protein